MQRAGARQLCVGDMAAGELAGERLQGAHDREGLIEVGQGELGDGAAAVRRQQNQALGRQYSHGLAQRRARHAEALAQLLLRKLLRSEEPTSELQSLRRTS